MVGHVRTHVRTKKPSLPLLQQVSCDTLCCRQSCFLWVKDKEPNWHHSCFFIRSYSDQPLLSKTCSINHDAGPHSSTCSVTQHSPSCVHKGDTSPTWWPCALIWCGSLFDRYLGRVQGNCGTLTMQGNETVRQLWNGWSKQGS